MFTTLQNVEARRARTLRAATIELAATRGAVRRVSRSLLSLGGTPSLPPARRGIPPSDKNKHTDAPAGTISCAGKISS